MRLDRSPLGFEVLVLLVRHPLNLVSQVLVLPAAGKRMAEAELDKQVLDYMKVHSDTLLAHCRVQRAVHSLAEVVGVVVK